MTIPAWILDIFAAVMLAVAAVSATRLVALRPWRRGRGAVVADIDVAHLLMAIAMAGTLTASLHTLPDGAWTAVFGVLTAWFAYQVARDARSEGARALADGHSGPHLVHSAAMLYMFAAIAAPAAGAASGMGGMSGSGMQTLNAPVLALIFALLLIGYVVWDLDQVSGPGAGGHYSFAVPRVLPAGAVLAGVPAPAGAESRAAAVPGPAGTGSGAAAAVASPVPTSCAADQVIGGGASPVLAPWVATSCRIAMGVTMAFMLIIMI